ncbi:hypothetical protein TYRP_011959 [Tyrophagus putrescentiae]|nr:hypothetical protein TYRP_011959 [Tyrophagus putrescentiae]
MKSVMQSIRTGINLSRRNFSSRESQENKEKDVENEDQEDFSEAKRVTEIFEHEDYKEEEEAEEGEDVEELRLTVLRNFVCPFAAETTCRFEETPTACPFGHRATAPISESALLTIPDYVLQEGSNILHSGKRKFKLHLPDCTSAIHLRLTTLLDLERFELQYAPVIAEYYNDESGGGKVLQRSATKKQTVLTKKKAEDGNLEGDDRFTCGICLERVRSSRLKERRQFALLESYDHVFCGPCMLAYRRSGKQETSSGDKRNSNSQENCPLCRVPSRRLALSDRFLAGGSDEKRKLFDSFHCRCCL